MNKRPMPAITEEPGELGHWIAAPMNKIRPGDDEVTRFHIFHEVVERAEKVINLLRDREAAARRNLEITHDTIRSITKSNLQRTEDEGQTGME